MKFEVIQIERERAIGSAAYQLTDLLDQRWLTVGSEAHDFVFIFIHVEAEIRGECRIQHPQRMRKSDFTKASDCCGTELDAVVFYERPMLKFDRILTSALRAFPQSWRAFPKAMKNSLGEKVWMRGTQPSTSLRDPETACNGSLGLHSTTTVSDPG